MSGAAGLVTLYKKDDNGTIIDKQETYNREMVDALLDNLLREVDLKISEALTQDD